MKKILWVLVLAAAFGVVALSFFKSYREDDVAKKFGADQQLKTSDYTASVYDLSEKIRTVYFKDKEGSNSSATAIVDIERQRVVVWINHLSNGHEILVPARDNIEFNISILHDGENEIVKVIRTVNEGNSRRQIVYDQHGRVEDSVTLPPTQTKK